VKLVWAALSSVAILLTACDLHPVPVANDPGTPEYYTTRVQPILQANCYRCHGGFNHRGGLNLQTKAGMLKGGHDGSVLVAGDPAKSLLVRLMRHEGPKNDPMPMPPAPRPKLLDADIAVVEQWIKAGAIAPPGK
jgi:cytochrome c